MVVYVALRLLVAMAVIALLFPGSYLLFFVAQSRYFVFSLGVAVVGTVFRLVAGAFT